MYCMVISNVSLENRESDMNVIRADYSRKYHSTIMHLSRPYSTVDSVLTHTSLKRVISTVSNRSALGILGRISSGWWPLNECLKKELSTVHLWQSTKKGEKRVWVMA